MEKEKLRNEIDDKYKWDLSSFYKNNEEVEKDIEKVKLLNDKLIGFKGNILKDSKTLSDFYETYIDYDNTTTNLYVYASLLCDTDTADNENQALKMKIEKLIDDLNVNLSFIDPEILSSSYLDVQKMIEKDPKLKKYAFDLECKFRYKDHTLSNNEEKILIEANNIMGTGEEVFNKLDNVDINLGIIEDENNNKIELTNSNYIKYLSSKDIRVRKDAFTKMYKYWESIKNTISVTYKSQIKENFFNSRIRKYESPLMESLYYDSIDISVYKNLINTIHDNLDKMYDYLDFRKKVLKLDELHMYDMYVDLCDGENKKISFEEGKNIVFEALKPLGEDYLNNLKKAFSEKWIDVYPNKGKKSGAYHWGTKDSNSYVLLNYDDTVDSVSTMAHELGHAMHSYYSKNKQDYLYYNYPIFLAEIASTVNEILLNDYLCKTAKTKEEKILYLNEFLDKIKGTIYRQTMFAEFEMIMHDKYDQNISLTDDEFNKTYYDLIKLYFGENVVCDDLIKYEWKRIPHFYSSFYVYKYATGMSAAIKIASDIINNVPGIKEKYIEFLSSGGSNYPLEILKELGVDMTSPLPIQQALDMFLEKLNELKTLF